MNKGIVFSLDALIAFLIISAAILFIISFDDDSNSGFYPMNGMLGVMSEYKIHDFDEEFREYLMDEVNDIHENYTLTEQMLYLYEHGESSDLSDFVDIILNQKFSIENSIEVYIDRDLIYSKDYGIYMSKNISTSIIDSVQFKSGKYIESSGLKRIWIKQIY
ncbi:hypothetical protein K9M79_04015 [Candidatus Woesearchaeota archaeon]|nr:hypothetical protein [Candidatus Woesearchaeota archaeon]